MLHDKKKGRNGKQTRMKKVDMFRQEKKKKGWKSVNTNNKATRINNNNEKKKTIEDNISIWQKLQDREKKNRKAVMLLDKKGKTGNKQEFKKKSKCLDKREKKVGSQ